MMRTLAVVAALLAFAAVIALDTPVPGGTPAAGGSFSSDPRSVQAVCPGPQAIPVGDIQSGDTNLDSGSTDVRYEVQPAGGAVIDEGTAFEEAGVSVERIGTGDLAGLAGMTCAPAAHDQWLVGGATVLGSSARLVLSNPADTSVSATVTLHTPVGVAEDATSVVLGPGAQRVLLLEALEPEMPGLAVHVSAGGAGVSAALQDSRLDGFTSAGTDWVSASTLGTALAIPTPAAADGDEQARLALLAPDGADVTLSMVTESGDVAWVGESTHNLAAGVLTELPVPSAESGVVIIEASADVAAATMTRVAREAPTDENDEAYDFAWTGAQEIGDSRARASVAPSQAVIADGAATVIAYASEPGTYHLTVGDEQVEIAIAAGQSTEVPIEAEPGTVIRSDEPLTWALVLTDEPGFIATLEPVSIEQVVIDTNVSVGNYLPSS